MHSFETSVSNRRSAISKKQEVILDIDILPNRAHDCLSHLGIARECAALLESKIKNFTMSKVERQKSKTQTKNQKYNIKDYLEIKIENKELCPRYTAIMMADVKVGPSPKWIRERLEVCGLRPINNIVDATNYAMLELGQPLHAFDFDKIKSMETPNSKSQIRNKFQIQNPNFSKKQIIARRAKNGERITTIEGKIYDLDESVLVIADNEKPIAIAGIKGGQGPEIDKDTKTIILEAANFNSVSIQCSSRKLSLRTDASIRFGYGIDPNLTVVALERAANLIQEIAGGEIIKGLADFYPRKVKPKIIILDLEKIKNLLGVAIPEKQVKEILGRLDFGVQGFQRTTKNHKKIFVSAPTRRLDIMISEDLIEEVARIYGYGEIPPLLPSCVLIPPKKNDLAIWAQKAKNILEGFGIVEVYNYSFVGGRDLAAVGAGIKDYIELSNPLSVDLKYLRQSLLINLLKNGTENLKYFKEFKIFELGKIYLDKSDEKIMLAGLIGGEEGLNEFYEIKGIVDSLLQKIGIPEVWYDDYIGKSETGKLWREGQAAEIKIDNQKIGILGEINPEISNKFEILKPIAGFELDFGKLAELAEKEIEYEPIPKFPSIVRDIAILVGKETRISEVESLVYSAGAKFVEDVDLFDIYEGEEIAEDKKNLAFHIIFRSKNRTLTDKEVGAEFGKIAKALEEELGAEIRK